MARSLFGGRPGDFAIVDPATNAFFAKVAPAATGTVWSAQTGGTQHTDLLTAGGSAITTISSDASGTIVGFQGPDGVRTLWADFGGGRRLLESQTFAADYAAQRGILIADTKLEFGTDENGRLLVMDEMLTPDSSRFWPADTYEIGTSPPSYDKQFVRDYLETLDWNKTAPGPRVPAEVIEGTRAKYAEALQRLAGISLG